MLRLLLAAMLVTAGCSSGPAPEKPKAVGASNGKELAPNPPAVQVAPLKVGTGAILDLTRSPLGTLFETKLLAGEKLKWLERSLIDKVLAEQDLQALFSPEAGSKRAKFGKVLKADVLILLRSLEDPAKKEASRIELVVCETQRGLRLAAHTIATSKDAAADVDALDRFVDEALKKAAGKITDVCAVPPFMNNDLDYKYDHLKAAFAQLIENQVIKRPGVLVVELAEAQALAKEAALAGGENLQRQLPLYFLGEFRNEGKNEAGRLTIHVNLKRGEKELASQTKNQVRPAEIAGVLGRIVDEMAANVLGKGGEVSIDPKAEAKQLVERALAFQRVGNWDDSLALLEASLLLDTSLAEVRHFAALASARVADQHYRKGDAYKEGMLAMAAHRRMLEHEEHYMRSGPQMTPPRAPDNSPPPDPKLNEAFPWTTRLKDFGSTIAEYKNPVERKAALDLRAEVSSEHREFLLRLCRLRAWNGNGDEHRYLERAIIALPTVERHKIVLEMIQELKNLPWAKERTIMFTRLVIVHRQLSFVPEDGVFLDKLLSINNAHIRAAAEVVRKEEVAYKVDQKTAPKIQIAVNAQEIRFTPLRLIWDAPHGKAVEVEPIFGILPVGDRIDLIMASERIFLMKEKGRLKQIWEAKELNDRPAGYCYDGRYAWIPIQRLRRVPQLLVFDPVSEKTWEFTAEDGLPLAASGTLPEAGTFQTIAAAPVAPGKACLAGYFGRSWLALATFDPQRGKSVKVFYEARETANRQDPEDWKRTTIAFRPSYLHALVDKFDDKGNRPRRILIGRGETHGQFPLLVDPERLSVSVLHQGVSHTAMEHAVMKDGAAYYISSGPGQPGWRMMRLGFPNFTSETIIDQLAEGRVAFLGDQPHHFFSPRGLGTLSEKSRISFSPSFEGFRDVLQSSHYGTLVNAQLLGKVRIITYHVDFPSGQKWGPARNVILPPPPDEVPENYRRIIRNAPTQVRPRPSTIHSDTFTVPPGKDGVLIEGELTKDGKTLGSGQPYKIYSAPMVKGTTYAILLESKDFDAFLRVGLDGKVVAHNLAEGDKRSARLAFTPRIDGTYAIQVMSFNKRYGGYQLWVRVEKAPDQKP